MRLIAPLLLLLCLTTSCALSTPASSASDGARVSPRPARERAGDPFAGVEESVLSGSTAMVAFDAADLSAFTPSLALVDGEALDASKGPTARQVVYTADLEIVVVSADQATRAVQSIAEQSGGHLQESDSRSITVRVPAERFDATVEQIESLGAVTDRAIFASDVTEEMIDLTLRLENAKRARDRLLAHLADSRKIADTLQIEAELTRVSETIEEIEGKLRFKRSQIAMSTITVVWNVEHPEPASIGSIRGLPFHWIRELGDGLVAGHVEPLTREPRLFDFAPRFEPPSGFIRYFSSRTLVEALSADGLRIKVRRHANHDGGAVDFWRQLARESLVRDRALAVSDERALDAGRALIAGTREIGGETRAYLLVLKRTRRFVYSFEAWGPSAAFERHRASLEESAKSMRR